jgi:hypothetical protein
MSLILFIFDCNNDWPIIFFKPYVCGIVYLAMLIHTNNEYMLVSVLQNNNIKYTIREGIIVIHRIFILPNQRNNYSSL